MTALLGAGLGALAVVIVAAYGLARAGGRITSHHHDRHHTDQPGAALARAIGHPEYLSDLPVPHRRCATCRGWTPHQADANGGHHCTRCNHPT